jgi:HAE1 family hydrophobic/amphiphilic exporter-1
MPRAEMPYVTITTIYPGASPSEIETDIAKPIEDQMVTLDGSNM